MKRQPFNKQSTGKAKTLEMFEAFEMFLVEENLKICVKSSLISAWMDERHFTFAHVPYVTFKNISVSVI